MREGFGSTFKRLVEIRLVEEPYGEGHQTKQIYYLQFKPQVDDSDELIESFVHHVGCVLNLWLTDALVESRWEILE